MAYDEKLASRLSAILRDEPGFEPRRMFGSIGWFLRGNLCVGTWKDGLLVRCTPEEWPRFIEETNVGPCDITGRTMKGWLIVKAPAIASDRELARWIGIARDFVGTLPAKKKKASKRLPPSTAKKKNGRAGKTKS